MPRRGAPIPYPDEAPRGPLVLLTNEAAGSDGDIFTQGFKLLGLGPVVGTRTWGGVIGIDVNPRPWPIGSVATRATGVRVLVRRRRLGSGNSRR